MAGTPESSQQERDALRAAVSQSEVLQRIAPGLLGPQPPDLDAIAKTIRRLVGSTSGTAAHRAHMIANWRKTLLQTSMLGERRESRMNGMWRRVELKNYRSIENVNVDLAPFTLLVGPNGSGKSNFADALVFARDVAVDASSALENRGGIIGVRRWRPSKPTDVTVDVRAGASKAALETDYVRHQFTIHSGQKGDWSFRRELVEHVVRGETQFRIERIGNRISAGPKVSVVDLTDTASVMILARQFKDFSRGAQLQSVRRYRLNPEEMRKPQLSSERTRLEESGANIATATRSLKKTKSFSDILAAMQKIVPGLVDIYPELVGRFISLKFRQQKAAGETAEFNATEMSEGALRAYGIIVASYQMTSEELLVIEEPEVSIHVGAANVLFDVLKHASERGAVLVTTHSADLLDAARDEEILVCDYRAGLTRIGELAAAQRAVVRDGLFSVAELMRSEPLRIEGQAPLHL